MAIKRLESEFDTELIKRNQAHHQVKLSDKGKILYKHTKRIVKQTETLKKDMHHNFAEPIRIGLPPIISNYYFPSLANQLSQAGILNDLDNVETGSEKLLDMLKKGDIDIALLGSNSPIKTKAIKATELAKSQYKIIVAPDSPLAKLKSIKIKDIANYDFISLSHDFVTTQTLEQLCKNHSIKLNIRYRTQDVELIKHLVSENIGISFLIGTAIKKDDNIVAIPVDDDELTPFYISIAYRKSHVLSPKENKLIKLLTNEITNKKTLD